MARNPDHAMLGRANHDERARQMFIGAYKQFVGRGLRPGNRAYYQLEARPAFESDHGHEPESPGEIGEAMRANMHWQLWSALHRAGQELMWSAVSDTLTREELRTRETYAELTGSSNKLGSLELDADLAIPKVIRKTEIHLQPGGYALDSGDDDFRAGALYEAGGALYSRSQGVGTAESKGEIIIRFIAEQYGEFQPKRILDMGCSAGSSSTPYAEAFPDAEVHAIDVAPGLLRYAHARAEAMGLAVHFHQRDIADTRFPDESFDLVVSHNAMHEISSQTCAAMMRESYRLLAPGGICVHQDVPLRFSELDDYGQFDLSWDLKYNNEPFWKIYATNDPRQMLEDAGFDQENIYVGRASQADGKWSWFVASARK